RAAGGPLVSRTGSPDPGGSAGQSCRLAGAVVVRRVVLAVLLRVLARSRLGAASDLAVTGHVVDRVGDDAIPAVAAVDVVDLAVADVDRVVAGAAVNRVAHGVAGAGIVSASW